MLQANHKTAGHATSKLDTKTESGFSKMGGNDLVMTVVTNSSGAGACRNFCYSKSFIYNFSMKIVFLSHHLMLMVACSAVLEFQNIGSLLVFTFSFIRPLGINCT